MKLKFISAMVMIGAIALTTATGWAQNSPQNDNRLVPKSSEQTTPSKNSTNSGNPSLTPAQRSQVAQIRENTRFEIDRILTPEQKAQWQQWQTQPRTVVHQPSKTGLGALKLSPEQRQKIKELFQAERQEISKILTPDQLKQVAQILPRRSF